MSSLGGEENRSRRVPRSQSSAEAIEAREHASLSMARTTDVGAAPNTRPTAEILRAAPEPWRVPGQHGVLIATALVLATIYLVAMLALAITSPYMF